MAITLPNSFFCILTISIFLSSILYQAIGVSGDGLVDDLNQNHKSMKQKLNHYKFYWHDIVSGPKPTSISITKPLTRTGFGQVTMIDNPLTLRPNLTSKVVGKAQGLYGAASQEEVGLMMIMNFVFLYGKYNGSTLTIMGSNAVFHEVREMPVVGGSGLFRFARGYAQARTHFFDTKTGDAIVQYDVYVMHY